MAGYTYARVRDADTGALLDACVRRSDGMLIRNDPGNLDWQAYLASCADGNVPDLPPWIPPPRRALGSALRDALKSTGQSSAWQAALAGQSQDTRDWWCNRYDQDIPIDATKLARIAKACTPPVSLPDLYTAAGS